MTVSCFPRGMVQPEQGFRFAVDSLLLSVFISPGKKDRIMDLGCGCGVIGLGLLLAHVDKELHLVGIDSDPEMVRCARENSIRLGLEEKTSFINMDAADVNSRTMSAESFDLVLMNPPYRRPGSGRSPEHHGKKAATFARDNQTGQFLKAAGFALRNLGRAGIVFPASRLDELLLHSNSCRLRPKIVRPVLGRPDKPASLVLVQARKNAGQEMVIPPPLVLYDEQNALTRQAREFCPFLECNPGRG